MLNKPTSLDPLFQALGDATRRVIVERLTRGPLPVTALARDLPISLPGVMQHLAVLERCGLIRSEKTGRTRTCTLDPGALLAVTRWCDAQRAVWNDRLDALGHSLDDTQPQDAL